MDNGFVANKVNMNIKKKYTDTESIQHEREFDEFIIKTESIRRSKKVESYDITTEATEKIISSVIENIKSRVEDAEAIKLRDLAFDVKLDKDVILELFSKGYLESVKHVEYIISKDDIPCYKCSKRKDCGNYCQFCVPFNSYFERKSNRLKEPYIEFQWAESEKEKFISVAESLNERLLTKQ